jgi:group II intron reverse transcriptase/maturase
MELTTLAHHIDEMFLVEAYRRTRKDGAVGIDGQTAAEYATELPANLQDLLERLKAGTYYAPPVRRVHIPKGDGSQTRPIGIPTFEDKLLQRAVAMVLEAVYEQEFHDFSYGFRPGRSAHQALQALWDNLMVMGGGWLLDVDLKSFYDTIDHGHLRSFLDQRVRDGVLRRTIDKWLKAGVLEDGELSHPEEGTPQGGVISPILANIFLHHVLDEWFVQEARPRLAGKSFMVRYADDLVIVCETERDAQRMLKALHGRVARFGLTLHPEKTRLVDFRHPRRNPGGKPGTFDLLGFTHFWGRSRKGNWVVRRKTAASRFRRTIKRIGEWCRKNRHLHVQEQHRSLSEALKGHDQYYGITGNWQALNELRQQVRRTWRKWLDRRSHKARMVWQRFIEVLKRFPLPLPRVTKSVFGRQLKLFGARA